MYNVQYCILQTRFISDKCLTIHCDTSKTPGIAGHFWKFNTYIKNFVVLYIFTIKSDLICIIISLKTNNFVEMDTVV